MKFFNTAGPTNCNKHYCIEPLERINHEEIIYLINSEKYFILHAPRQTGKTTCLLSLMEYLNKQDDYKCLYINVEAAQAARENVYHGISSILDELSMRAVIHLKDSFPQSLLPSLLTEQGFGTALNKCLTLWCSNISKPLVLLIDEIDSLVGDTLISVLRQIRSGYDKRPSNFPQSIILCGVRDIRDYRIHSDKEKSIITGGSAFNIKAKSLKIGDFSKQDICKLYQCHTTETGQQFEEGVFDLVWDLTSGQPWLVNALGYEACFDIKTRRDRTKTITKDMILEAKDNLILRRETHLDQLVDKLQEERIKRVVLPLLTGLEYPKDIPTDDISYARDLGLIKTDGQIRIANLIYQETIPRELTYSTQVTISHNPLWYIKEDGKLDINKLLSAFQEFYRENSEIWLEKFSYKEAGHHLLLQAFLQRIINSGGQIIREYGLGMMRTDLFIIWFYGEKKEYKQKIVIELKMLHSSLEKTIEKGLMQTNQYMDKCQTDDGHLVIFDKTNKPWNKKIFQKKLNHENKIIYVWGM